MAPKRKRQPYKPPLTIARILAWADAHYRRHGTWPFWKAGPIAGTKNETWAGVAFALYSGTRGMKGNVSLARLLRRARRVYVRRPALDKAIIFRWARAHHRRTGEWPGPQSGAIHDAPGETWLAVTDSLQMGRRGLSPGSSLTKLLAEHGIKRERRRPNRNQPRLDMRRVRSWASAHRRRTGTWPHHYSGAIPGSHGLTWEALDNALRLGLRGLPGGSSLAKLFGDRRQKRFRR
jgi:hypothetical protein